MEKACATFFNMRARAPAPTVKLRYLTATEVKNIQARSKLDVSFGF